MPWFIECPFCHKSVFRWFYSRHEAQHTERLEDGQMSDHVTLAPEERYQGSLEDVPESYYHAECDTVTGMPEEIIRSYLVDPFRYSDATFCSGCGDYVDSAEVTWVETDESVMEYNCRLRCDYVEENFGVDPRAHDVFVTPAAVKAARRWAKEERLAKPWYFLFELVEDENDAHHEVHVVDAWDKRTQALIELEKIDVLVWKNQRKLLRGMYVHHSSSGANPSFFAARLYIPE